MKPSGATVFHGQCEWEPGQLEEELAIGAWQVGCSTWSHTYGQGVFGIISHMRVRACYSLRARWCDGLRCWRG